MSPRPAPTAFLAAGLALFLPSAASAAVTLDWVMVGNPGNADDSTGFGSVAYSYLIGKYEVTIGQYTEFLNAVDPNGTNTRSLYNTNMGSNANIAGIGFSSGASVGTKYSVIGSSNRPVTYVSWFDAARFSNWMHNGQGAGDTEFGAYALNGATSGVGFSASPSAGYRLPTEDEWYKAAYYDPTPGASVDNYWLYPTQSDSPPGNDVGGGPNLANYFAGDLTTTPGNNIVSSSQDYLTDVGTFTGSDSYYGTFDQGGNVQEWNDFANLTNRGVRGGNWFNFNQNLWSSRRNNLLPANEDALTGFRLASVPEPSGVLMAGLSGLVLLTRRRRPAL